jgi:FKBP-type peptidyl-prolyl cis-trans isomerase (trigger factor)
MEVQLLSDPLFMISAIQKTEDGTVTLTITIPWKEAEAVRKETVEKLSAEAELPGFRKGKAPKNLIEEKLDPQVVRDETLRKLLPKFYLEAVGEHKLNPIISPLIHVQDVEEGKDWQFTAKTAEAPKIDLGGYKENVKKITAKSKIIVPGKENQPPNFEEIARELLNTVKLSVPKIIVDREVERLLAQLLDEIRRLGLNLDQYLASSGKTIDNLRAEQEIKAQNDIKLELILQRIAEEEKIEVSDKEIDDAVKNAKTPEERQSLEANKYLLASIIRQQKTLEFLRNL